LGVRRLSFDPFVVTNSGLLGTAVNKYMIVQVTDAEVDTNRQRLGANMLISLKQTKILAKHKVSVSIIHHCLC